jgi:predicted metalloprotease with PDZ domain
MIRIMAGLGAAAACLFSLQARADVAELGPVAASISPDVPATADRPYPGGTLSLQVDARDTVRGLFKVNETIPVVHGTRALTLLYPEWIQGHHAPRGPINLIGALTFSVSGKPIIWRRDPANVFAFHLELPPGANEVAASFIYTSPLSSDEGRIAMTQALISLQWDMVSLYPAGYYSRQIKIRPVALLPEGWTAVAALDGADADGSRVTWTTTDYETLVDSPVLAGLNFRRWDLGHNVELNTFSDTADQLGMDPHDQAKLDAMVDEALTLFGRPPFDRYEFLVSLSDRLGGIGLEHQRSSEVGLSPRALSDWGYGEFSRNVLVHELVHSWNGKFRRPAGLWTPDFQQPTDDRLLWVYEGLTQYLGFVLAVRSNLQTKQTVLDMLAHSAAALTGMEGRKWRSLADTAYDPIVDARRPRPFPTLTRGEDYYTEGALVWLEVDQIIQAGTGGKKSLDDFAHAFFAYPGGGLRQKTYTEEDLIEALNAVYPNDWAGFFAQRIDAVGVPDPLGGLEKGGYNLVWRDEPNAFDRARMMEEHLFYLDYSLGVQLDDAGKVTTVRWGSPAFEAGLVTGARIVSVGDQAYSAEVLRRAILSARSGRRPIQFTIKRHEETETVSIDYHDGLRWPWLEPIARGENTLDKQFAPRVPAGG